MRYCGSDRTRWRPSQSPGSGTNGRVPGAPRAGWPRHPRRGEVVLGHLRLSILDPSPAGEQPMCRGGLTLVHNGEVYNYLELADELPTCGHRITPAPIPKSCSPPTRSGVSTRSRGSMACSRSRSGMRAAAGWCSAVTGGRQAALRPADRSIAGVRERGEGVPPQQDPSTRRTTGDLSPTRRPSTTSWSAGRPTTRPDVPRGRHRGSSAAHLLVVEDGHERTVRYWGPPSLADDDRGRGLRRPTCDAMPTSWTDSGTSSTLQYPLRLRSDVPIGTCLSGGLDSSSIVMTVADTLA